MSLLGSPWAKEKSQQADASADFLGLVHELGRASQGTVLFWPRKSLVDKVWSIMAASKEGGAPPWYGR